MTKQTVEPFVVRHYAGDERPTIKGNGFDGLEVGETREDAQEFVDWLNARLADEPSHRQPGLTRGEMAEAQRKALGEPSGVYTCKHGTFHSCSACCWEAKYLPERTNGDV